MNSMLLDFFISVGLMRKTMNFNLKNIIDKMYT